jgi:hypothetical protein
VRGEEEGICSTDPIKVQHHAEAIYQTAGEENLQKDKERNPLAFLEFGPLGHLEN